MILLIFVRKGCCICDALKNNLKKINLENIYPDLKIQEIDIDRYDLYKDEYKKYDNEVPVIALKNLSSNQLNEFPRVSPRVKEIQLESWLKKNIKLFIN
tara:strand:+ start:103 stop:399 length:297 start_codon:yes stop_codon:yes gene_type:complete